MPRSRILVLALSLLLAGPAAADAATPKRRYYVSLGDSYAIGYQPSVVRPAGGTRNGFAYQVPALAKPRGYRFKLVNFGCGGETTLSLLERTARCGGPAPGGPDYAGRTQIAAAGRFLRAHRGKVGLITVSIGGNDVTKCVRDANPITCVGAAVEAIKQNVTEIAKRLREAAGRKVPIVGITYPSVILGLWVGPDANQDLARLSVVALKELINPELKRAYASAGGKLVDVTAASGAYGSLEEKTTIAAYGEIPLPVAKVCEYTYYCEFRDIHARTSGHRLVAELIVKTLPRR
ncbi:MAG TPA: SGNH/GDSL hydrolase family protein [Solirubrobacteraceae bacterium]|nr:SGNH/GDSL hydrolase family protein [Solirubrobacteraceae bacterium]